MTPIEDWKRLAIVDVETTGLDPTKDHVVETAIGIWDIGHRCLVDVCSFVTQLPDEALTDEARKSEAVHGLPLDMCRLGRVPDPRSYASKVARAGYADAWLAYNADFDQSFLGDAADRRPWVDVQEMPWPKTITAVGNGGAGRSLVAVALAHGVPVVNAHRALSDVLTTARLLERACELGADPFALLAYAARPRAFVIADAPRSQNDTLKANFFRWNPDRQIWWRKMPLEDAAKLPFRWHEGRA